MTIPDPIGDLAVLLKGNSGVAAIASARVFSGGLPQAQQTNMPQATVILKPAGGPGRPKRLKIRRTFVDTICYGTSLHQAWQLHLAVREALETLAPSRGSVKAVEMASEAVNAIDASTQWPTCYASYRVLATTTV
jgi:hypothetical protein